MKKYLLVITLCLGFSHLVSAGSFYTVKGTLLSYNSQHIRLKVGEKIKKIPLKKLSPVEQFVLSEKINKEMVLRLPLT